MINLTKNYKVKLRILTACLQAENFYNHDFRNYFFDDSYTGNLYHPPTTEEEEIERLEHIFDVRIKHIMRIYTPALLKIEEQEEKAKEAQRKKEAKKATKTPKKRGRPKKTTSKRTKTIKELEALEDISPDELEYGGDNENEEV